MSRPARHVLRASVVFAMISVSFSVLAQAPAAPPPASARPSTTLADVAFLTGQWVFTGVGEQSEEFWAPPAGDCMVGTWRWVLGGKVKLFEFLMLVQEEDGIIFRMRHFDRKGVGWEDKDAPMLLTPTKVGKDEIVFDGGGKDGMVRLTYKRTGDELNVLLEKTGQKEEFRFKRKAGGPS
jgi:hypothetical protein